MERVAALLLLLTGLQFLQLSAADSTEDPVLHETPSVLDDSVTGPAVSEITRDESDADNSTDEPTTPADVKYEPIFDYKKVTRLRERLRQKAKIVAALLMQRRKAGEQLDPKAKKFLLEYLVRRLLKKIVKIGDKFVVADRVPSSDAVEYYHDIQDMVQPEASYVAE